MSTRLLLGFVATAAMLTALPADAGPADGFLKCQSGKFVGTYGFPTRVPTQSSLDLYNLPTYFTFHSDGTFRGVEIAGDELRSTTGTQSEYVGSWSCLPDDNILLNFSAHYFVAFPSLAVDFPQFDTTLVDVIWRTYIFKIKNADTLVRVYASTRRCHFWEPDDNLITGVENCDYLGAAPAPIVFKEYTRVSKTTTRDIESQIYQDNLDYYKNNF